MRVLDRDVRAIAAAPFRGRHWGALRRMFEVYEHPVQALLRYLSNSGPYPWTPALRTPTGIVRPVLMSRHDLLTVNEIFCRHDYGDGQGIRVVVDIGANIGLAALFFLTRSPEVRVYCFEPDPTNLERARALLGPYEARVTFVGKAVTAARQDAVRFVSAGRYGHEALPGELGVDVPAVAVVEVLDDVLSQESFIDVMKIDTEGTEFALVEALQSSDLRGRVRAVVFEDNQGHTRWV